MTILSEFSLFALIHLLPEGLHFIHSSKQVFPLWWRLDRNKIVGNSLVGFTFMIVAVRESWKHGTLCVDMCMFAIIIITNISTIIITGQSEEDWLTGNWERNGTQKKSFLGLLSQPKEKTFVSSQDWAKIRINNGWVARISCHVPLEWNII